MQNKFPIVEEIEYEEIYGKKRPQSMPYKVKTTYNLRQKRNKNTEKEPISFDNSFRMAKFTANSISETEKIAELHKIENYIEKRNHLLNIQKEKGCVNFEDCGSMDFNEFIKIKMFLERWSVINIKEELLKDMAEIEHVVKEVESSTQCAENSDSTDRAKDTKNDENIENSDEKNDYTNIVDHRSEEFIEKNIKSINESFKEQELKEKKIMPEKSCACNNDKTYYNLKDSTIICHECLEKGNYPSNVSFSDFFPLSDISMYLTDLDDSNLLESIRKFNDDWQKVADEVKMSKEECILRFLKKELLSLDSIKNIPLDVLTTSDNRIMSVVSFLCSCVDARVAAAFAKSIITNYEKNNCDEIDVKHAALIKEALKDAQKKARELLVLERQKLVRLTEVLVEAQIKKMELKEEAFGDLKNSFKNERIELVKIREGYKGEIEEIKKEM